MAMPQLATRRHSPIEWKAKILVVDDNAENLVALEAVLDSPAYQLVKASSGLEALRLLLKDDFAAILLDVKMPEIDGFETATLIRARKRSQHTPILFLTAFKHEDQLFRGYHLGAVDFLFKPIVPEILQSKVAAFVQLHRHSELLRQQAETLKRAEQKFRALMEAAPDAMVLVRPDGEIDLINSRAERLFDTTRDQLMGHPISRFIPEWSLDFEVSRTVELEALSASGLRVPIEVSSSPLETAEGRVTICAIREITVRKRAESEIQELNSILEQKVRERTAELLRSNDDLAQFAYVASHDLKEPLRTIAIFTELLQEEQANTLSAPAREGLAHILGGVKRMQELIDDLLAYSHVESGSTLMKRVDLNVSLSEVTFDLGMLIEESGAQITSDRMESVLGDRVQLTQVLQNLIGNSIKYRSADPPRIHLSCAAAPGGVQITVEDNGIGIDQRYADAVFKLFKRLHGREQYPGNGVGLAICRKIVERHGGRIWMEHREGGGSRFCFTLPAADAEALDSSAAKGEAPRRFD